MEKMREVADAYYNGGAEDVKRVANDFFNSMDLNGDRRVILREYLAFTEKRGFIRMSNLEWFRMLDKDKKGSLSFHDVMTLCYIVKSGRPFCKGCGQFLSGLFFTCIKCFDSSPTSFCVCLQCYESNNIEHEHKEFLDNFALLEAKRRKSLFPTLRATAAAQTLRKESHPQVRDGMEGLRQIAMAYCRTTSEDFREKEKIRKLFSSMHYGNDERVALHEFLEFMRQKSYKQYLMMNQLDVDQFMSTAEFFRKLDKDKKGLDFSDVKTLYYIIQSGRPFCKGCGEFIAGMFFTCVRCFEGGAATFSLCLHCYNGHKFIHTAAHHLFLDNYALLEAMRETAWKAKNPKTHAKANDLKQSASLAMLLKVNSFEESTSSPGPIVSLNNKPKFTTKANTSSLGSIVSVTNKPITTKAIASTANSLVKVIDKTTNAKDTFEALEAAMNMAIATAMTVSGFSAVCVIL